MSFSFSGTATSAAEAKEKVAAETAPQSIKDYVVAAIDGLYAKLPDTKSVTYSAYGHLCDAPDSHEVSTATVGVSPTPAE